MTNLLPVVKQRIHAVIGLCGVVGGSARGPISRGTWETPWGGRGIASNAEREDITGNAAPDGVGKARTSEEVG
jgi:hypothetical protein